MTSFGFKWCGMHVVVPLSQIPVYFSLLQYPAVLLGKLGKLSAGIRLGSDS